MKTEVIHRTEVIRGKEYPVIITKRMGRQEIKFHGKNILVDSATIIRHHNGTTYNYTVVSPEEEANG